MHKMPANFKELVKRPLELFIFLLLLAMVLVTFSQVISRYVLQISLSWSEEAARFLLIWLGLISAGYAFKFRSHFSLTFFLGMFPSSTQKWITHFGNALQIAFLILFIYQSYQYLSRSVSGMTSPGLGISFLIPYSAVFFGAFVMLFYISKNAWEDWKSNPPNLREDSSDDTNENNK